MSRSGGENGEPRREQAHFQGHAEEDTEPDEDPDDSYFQDWNEQDLAFWQEARQQEHQAWMQLQQVRRTLKDARARQHEVKMGRRFYRPKGNGKGGRGTPIGAPPRSSSSAPLPEVCRSSQDVILPRQFSRQGPGAVQPGGRVAPPGGVHLLPTTRGRSPGAGGPE